MNPYLYILFQFMSDGFISSYVLLNMYEINSLTILYVIICLLGFYSGIGWSIMGKLPGLGARFGTYELLTAFYKGKDMFSHDSRFIVYNNLLYVHIVINIYIAGLVLHCVSFLLFSYYHHQFV
jgi:hypothetical protein